MSNDDLYLSGIDGGEEDDDLAYITDDDSPVIIDDHAETIRQMLDRMKTSQGPTKVD